MALQATPGGERPLRRDAENNRRLIIEAATSVFASRGLQVDVREIARRAGVGMGTLYRHFPTKDLLVETVVHEAFRDWARGAAEAMEREPDPWLALQHFIRDAVARQAEHRAFMDALASSSDGSAGFAACTIQIRPVVDALVARAHRSGSLRPDVGGDDILALVIALGRLPASRSDVLSVRSETCVAIVIDGLRAPSTG